MKQRKGMLNDICEKIKTRRQLKAMDRLWYFYGGNCFGMHPPSFYWKHSEEEIERIQKEEIAKLKEMLEEFEARH